MNRFPLLVCLLATLLTGCGARYSVQVDSLRNPDYVGVSSAQRYILLPEDKAISPDDLLFRELVSKLDVVFRSHGFDVVQNASQADRVTLISYGVDKPRTLVQAATVSGYELVTRRTRFGELRQDYVLVEKPQITTTTLYDMQLLLQTYALGPDGKRGPQIWRTSVKLSSRTDDFRRMCDILISPLYRTLGSQTSGSVSYEVSVDENGSISAAPVQRNAW